MELAVGSTKLFHVHISPSLLLEKMVHLFTNHWSSIIYKSMELYD